MFSFACFVFFFLLFFCSGSPETVLLKLDPLSGPESRTKPQDILLRLRLIRHSLCACFGFGGPHMFWSCLATQEKTAPPSSKSSFQCISQFYLLFTAAVCEAFRVEAKYSSGTCKCEVLVKKQVQVQAARQETAGGRQKIFLCGILVSLLNSLDNNACGEDKRYEGRMCLKVWESVERQKKR